MWQYIKLQLTILLSTFSLLCTAKSELGLYRCHEFAILKTPFL